MKKAIVGGAAGLLIGWAFQNTVGGWVSKTDGDAVTSYPLRLPLVVFVGLGALWGWLVG